MAIENKAVTATTKHVALFVKRKRFAFMIVLPGWNWPVVLRKQSIHDCAPVRRMQKGKLRDILAKNMCRLRADRGVSREALARVGNPPDLPEFGRTLGTQLSIDNIARIANRLQAGPWLPLKDE